MYSTRTDSIFCFCCVLFDGKRTKLSTPDSGYKDWNHVHSDLASHENTSNHKISFESWKKLRNRNTCASTIDSYQTRMLQNETEHWKQIFFRIVVAIKYLAGPSLAFRGTTEKLYEHNNGNFLKLIESFAEFDATMRAHMQKFLEGKSRNHYLSHDIQNEIIGIIAKSIRSVIITMAKQSVYFAVIADTTSDLSHKEQHTSSCTRLSSRAAAMKCLNESLPQIYDALIEISESSDFEEKSKFNATQLGHRIFKFKFVLSTVIWNEFLSRINVVSKVLQSKSMDFSSCSGHLKKLREYFQAVRLNSTYDSLYSKAEGIASQMNIPVDFAHAMQSEISEASDIAMKMMSTSI